MSDGALELHFDENSPGTPEEQGVVRKAIEAQEIKHNLYVRLRRTPEGWDIEKARWLQEPFRVVSGLLEEPMHNEGTDFTAWVRVWLTKAGIPVDQHVR